MQTSNFSHTGNIGDCWSAIPAMNTFYKKTGKKINLLLITDIAAWYYSGATHPTKGPDGNPVMLNQKMVDMMAPLLMQQECIASVKAATIEEPIDIHLEWIRETYVGMPNWPIQKWYFYVFPDLACDISLPWLTVPDAEKDYAKNKILITRSERYHNQDLSYEFLKPLEEECIFVGTMREYNQFCMAYDLNIRKLNVDNFLQLAQAIKQCRFHISNQTQAFQLSEGQKTPRIIELCHFAQNVNTFGPNGYEAINQYGMEYAVAALNNTESTYIAKAKEEAENKKAAQE